jgi:hypothetical protein
VPQSGVFKVGEGTKPPDSVQVLEKVWLLEMVKALEPVKVLGVAVGVGVGVGGILKLVFEVAEEFPPPQLSVPSKMAKANSATYLDITPPSEQVHMQQSSSWMCSLRVFQSFGKLKTFTTFRWRAGVTRLRKINLQPSDEHQKTE